MSDKKPYGEGETELRVGTGTLSEYFKPAKMGHRVTRQELLHILALYTQKVDVHEAMKVLDFNLRRALGSMLREEREALAAKEVEDKKGLIITP